MAQAAHAANQFISTAGKYSHVKKWQKEGDGFGTTIVLGLSGLELSEVGSKLMKGGSRYEGVFFNYVVDTTYPFPIDREILDLIPPTRLTSPPIETAPGRYIAFRSETTCAFLFAPSHGELKDELIGSLKLHP